MGTFVLVGIILSIPSNPTPSGFPLESRSSYFWPLTLCWLNLDPSSGGHHHWKGLQCVPSFLLAQPGTLQQDSLQFPTYVDVCWWVGRDNCTWCLGRTGCLHELTLLSHRSAWCHCICPRHPQHIHSWETNNVLNDSSHCHGNCHTLWWVFNPNAAVA